MSLAMKYFVLKPKAKNAYDQYAVASQMAMHAYADVIREDNPALARALDLWAGREAVLQERRKVTLKTPEDIT